MRIVIERNSLSKLHRYLDHLSSVYTIVTDTNLATKAHALAAQLKKHRIICHVLIVPAGEKTKSFEYVEKLITALIKLTMKRDSCLIAFGGGVIGDLTGFVASIYMRGIPYINIPTTVIAMADSSIGGKTGIDLVEGKNLVGSFYNPEILIIDPCILGSLPDREFKNGFAEIIKHAIIRDKTFFAFLEKNCAKILKRNNTVLLSILKKSVAIKMAIVTKDQKESTRFAQSVKGKTSSRMLVNYGHTIGHALEKASGYSIPHGHAVSIGIVAENRLAIERKLLKEIDARRIEKLLKAFGLPTRIPSLYADNTLKQHMLKDKKRVGSHIYFALPHGIGKATLVAFDQP